MKECIYCGAILKNNFLECPKCKHSLFNPFINGIDKLIEQKLQGYGIFFIHKEDKESFIRELKKYCKERNQTITKELLEKFLPIFKNILEKKKRKGSKS